MTLRDDQRLPALVVVALAFLSLLGACNKKIRFDDNQDAASAMDVQLPRPLDALADRVEVAGADATPDRLSSDAAEDARLEVGPVPRDGGGGIDAPVDRPSDAPLDAFADAPRDAPPDALGPFVCASEADCKLPSLHCLLAAGGLPGRCVECTGNGHCLVPGTLPAGRLCDPILRRCVECTSDTDCPSPSRTYPSHCGIPTHRCVTGCEDDVTTTCPTTRKYHCVDDIYTCVECQTNSDCAASSHGPICNLSEFACVQCLATTCAAGLKCDAVTGACVECRNSAECLSPGRPLCDPSTLSCVPVPP